MGTQNGRILWCTAELQKAVQKEKPLISQGLLDFFRHYWIVKWGGVNRTGYIKIMVDRKKQNGMYWLIGSQKFHLMKGITESLAGRVAIVDLLGLSQAELDGRADLVDPFMPTPEWIDRAHANLKRPWSLTDGMTASGLVHSRKSMKRMGLIVIVFIAPMYKPIFSVTYSGLSFSHSSRERLLLLVVLINLLLSMIIKPAVLSSNHHVQTPMQYDLLHAY